MVISSLKVIYYQTIDLPGRTCRLSWIEGDDTPLSVINCFNCLDYRKSISAMSVVEFA
jgi:hypothetical protein